MKLHFKVGDKVIVRDTFIDEDEEVQKICESGVVIPSRENCPSYRVQFSDGSIGAYSADEIYKPT